jgi:hypothetical protein
MSMTRRRWAVLAVAICVTLPFLLAGDSAKAETPPADHLTSETIDLGPAGAPGWGQTLWRDAEGNAYDLGLIFRLPGEVVAYVVGSGDVPTLIQHAAARWDVNPQRLLRVSWCESKYQPGVVNASKHAGLFQFQTIPGPGQRESTWAYASRGAGYAGASPLNAEANAFSAAWLAHVQGWGAWRASQGCW